MSSPSGPYDPPGRLSPDEAAALAGRVAHLAAAGLPLGSGLEATALELPRGRLRRALSALGREVEGGASVEEALAARGGGIPDHLRRLVQVASRSGRVAETLGGYLTFVHLGVDLRRTLWIRLAYPILALLLATGVFGFIATWMIGSFTVIFRDFGMSIPVLTRVLIGVSEVLQRALVPLGELVIGLVLIATLGRVFISASLLRSVLSGIPVIGQVWKNLSLAEFCQLLALLVEAQVPLPEALRLTGGGVGDARLERACWSMGAEAEQGLSLSQAMNRQRAFPPGLSRMLQWAEGHQSLPDSLRMAAEMFESRARSQAWFAGTVLAVLAVITVLLAAAALVVGIFLPMVTLIARLSG